jgi:hypothetical protein
MNNNNCVRMECEDLEKGWRVFLTPDEFETALNSVPHHRCRIAVLLMALSLRRTPCSHTVASDFHQKENVWWLYVEGKQSSDRYHATKSRNVWIPQPVMDEIHAFIETEGRDPEEPLIDVGARQVSNWIDRLGENAATRTGDERWTRLSPHDFRRYYATHFLLRLGVDTHTVQQQGGWKKPEHMWEYLLMPRDLVKRRFAEVGLIGSNPLQNRGDKSANTVRSNFAAIRKTIADSHTSVRGDVVDVLQEELSAIDDDIAGIDIQTRARANQNSSQEKDGRSDQSSLDGSWISSPGGVVATNGVKAGVWTRNRLDKEIEAVSGEETQWPSRAECIEQSASYAMITVIIGLLFANIGISLDPSTLEVTASPSSAAALAIGSTSGIGGVLWSDYRDRINDISFREWCGRRLPF